MAEIRAGDIIRAQVRPSTQTRLWQVERVAGNRVTLRMAWREGDTFPVLGRPREVSTEDVTRVQVKVDD